MTQIEQQIKLQISRSHEMRNFKKSLSIETHLLVIVLSHRFHSLFSLILAMEFARLNCSTATIVSLGQP